MWVGLYTLVDYSCRLEEDIWSPGTRVIRGCEPPDLSVGNQSPFLCKSNAFSFLPSHFSSMGKGVSSSTWNDLPCAPFYTSLKKDNFIWLSENHFSFTDEETRFQRSKPDYILGRNVQMFIFYQEYCFSLSTVSHTCNPSSQVQRQEDSKIEANLGYTGRSYLRKNESAEIYSFMLYGLLPLMLLPVGWLMT